MISVLFGCSLFLMVDTINVRQIKNEDLSYNDVDIRVIKVGSNNKRYGTKLKLSKKPKVVNNKKMLKEVAKKTKVDYKLLLTIAAIESGFDNQSLNIKTNATGLFNFIPSTWEYMTLNYGKKYGMTINSDPNNPKLNALMAAEYIKLNKKELLKVKKGTITNEDIFLAHLLGATGAKKIIEANDNELAALVLPLAAKYNPYYFYTNGKPLTIEEFNAKLKIHMENKIYEHYEYFI